MLDDKEAIEHAERYGWNGEEVEGSDHFAMIVQKGRPALRFGLAVATLQPLQISGYGRL